ncbi:MAG: MFS transporter, partial [Neisseriaceae bacterium]
MVILAISIKEITDAISYLFTRIKMKTLGIVLPIILILIIDNIDATAVNIAIPTLMQEFKSSLLLTSWVINIYISTSAAFFLLAGYFGRIFGIKKTMLLGTILIGLASIIVGSSNHMFLLLVGRFIQGAGYAFTFAMIFLIVKQYVPVKHQKFVIGLLTSFVAIFSAAGPFIGGAFIYYLSWRWIFLINIPFCSLCIMLLEIYMEETDKTKDIILKEIFILLLSVLMIFFLMLAIFYATNASRNFGMFLVLFVVLCNNVVYDHCIIIQGD